MMLHIMCAIDVLKCSHVVGIRISCLFESFWCAFVNYVNYDDVFIIILIGESISMKRTAL